MNSLQEYHPALVQATERVDVLPTLLVLGALLLALYPAFASKTKYGIPIAGYGNIFEPAWLLRLRFIRGSRSILKQGYEKVSE